MKKTPQISKYRDATYSRQVKGKYHMDAILYNWSAMLGSIPFRTELRLFQWSNEHEYVYLMII